MDILGLIALAKSQNGSLSASKVFHFKGVKSAVNLLPIQGEEGDVYKVEEDNNYYAWNETNWVNIGDILTADQAADLINGMDEDIKSVKKNLVLFQNTQPTSDDNRIWITETGNEVVVPSYEEFNELKSAVDMLAEGKTPVIPEIVPNQYVNLTTGEFTAYNNWSRTDYIPVTPGKLLYYLNTVISAYNCYYDADYNKIGNNVIMYAGTLSDGSPRALRIPNGAAYIAMSNTTAAMRALKLWSPSALIDDDVSVADKTYSSQKIMELVKRVPTVVLPSELYMAAGSTVNIYTDNILLGDYSGLSVTWQINSISWTDQYDSHFAMYPAVTDAGDYTIIFILRDKNNYDILLRKEVPLHVLTPRTFSGKKVLFLGDSLTAAGYYPYEIQQNLSSGGVESVGTLTAHPYFNDVAVSVQEEGRGGWSANDYVSYASKGSFTNAFWNPTTSKFDFSYYITQNGISAPDMVFLNLGTNGVETPEREVSAINEMIASIHAYNANMPIAVSLITPPATQDGWTSTTHGGSVYRFKRLALLLNQAYIDAFDNKIVNVYVSPVYFNLDREHDFPYRMEACSSRNPYEVYRQTDNVHPSKYGYFKFADIYWGMIQRLL